MQLIAHVLAKTSASMLSVFLMLVCVLYFSPSTAKAADPNSKEDISWNFGERLTKLEARVAQLEKQLNVTQQPVASTVRTTMATPSVQPTTQYTNYTPYSAYNSESGGDCSDGSCGVGQTAYGGGNGRRYFFPRLRGGGGGCQGGSCR